MYRMNRMIGKVFCKPDLQNAFKIGPTLFILGPTLQRGTYSAGPICLLFSMYVHNAFFLCHRLFVVWILMYIFEYLTNIKTTVCMYCWGETAPTYSVYICTAPLYGILTYG